MAMLSLLSLFQSTNIVQKICFSEFYCILLALLKRQILVCIELDDWMIKKLTLTIHSYITLISSLSNWLLATKADRKQCDKDINDCIPSTQDKLGTKESSIWSLPKRVPNER